MTAVVGGTVLGVVVGEFLGSASGGMTTDDGEACATDICTAAL